MTLADRLRVYFVVDPQFVADPVGVVSAAIAGGVTSVQLRVKAGDTAEFLRLAQLLREITRAQGVLFFVNDRTDIALACHADGVHVGPHDLPVDAVKSIAPSLIIGASAGDVSAARRAIHAGADYLGCGAVFDASATKPDASTHKGLGFISSIARVATVPFVGIGGITAETAEAVVSAGASGVAVVREIGAAMDPCGVAERLFMAVHRGLDSRRAI